MEEIKRNSSIDKINLQLQESTSERDIILIREEKKSSKDNQTKSMKQSMAKYCIFMDDMDEILNSCKIKNSKRKSTREIYAQSRDRIAHVLLKLFGFKVSHLENITLKHLNCLFSKKEIKVKPLRKNSTEETKLPYTPKMEKLLAKIKDDYIIVKDFIEKTYSAEKYYTELLTNENKFIVSNSKKYESSEIWSSKALKDYYVRRLNNQLKEAFKENKLNRPKITTQSYRRAAAQIIAYNFGLLVASKFLNCNTINYVKNYTDITLGQYDMKKILEKIYEVENEKDLKKEFYNNDQKTYFHKEIEELLE